MLGTAAAAVTVRPPRPGLVHSRRLLERAFLQTLKGGMRELHHIGIPTAKEQAGESFIEGGKVHVTDAEKSPNKIEWLRFEADSPMPDLLKTCAHIAYKVDDIKAEMEGKDVLMEPFNPMEGVTVAFIVEEGAPATE